MADADPVETLIRAVHKRITEDVVTYLRARHAHYPVDVFTEPPPGKHGKTVDGCSAAAIRHILASCIGEIESGRWLDYVPERASTSAPTKGEP